MNTRKIVENMGIFPSSWGVLYRIILRMSFHFDPQGAFEILDTKVYKGVTPRGWFVSGVQGGDRRTTHGTRDGFQSPKTLGEVGKVGQNRVCEPTVPCPENSENHPGGN